MACLGSLFGCVGLVALRAWGKIDNQVGNLVRNASPLAIWVAALATLSAATAANLPTLDGRPLRVSLHHDCRVPPLHQHCTSKHASEQSGWGRCDPGLPRRTSAWLCHASPGGLGASPPPRDPCPLGAMGHHCYEHSTTCRMVNLARFEQRRRPRHTRHLRLGRHIGGWRVPRDLALRMRDGPTPMLAVANMHPLGDGRISTCLFLPLYPCFSRAPSLSLSLAPSLCDPLSLYISLSRFPSMHTSVYRCLSLVLWYLLSELSIST